MENEKYLFVVSGAAGTGKDSVVAALRKAHPEIEKTVSATTRSPRPGEQEGVDYYYRTREQFQQLIAADEVVEHNFYNGNYYGTLKEEVNKRLEAVKVGLKRRQEHPDYDGSEEFNYFLSVVFPYDQLTILSYNRVVHDLNGMDEHAFVASLKFNFELMIMPGFPCKPVEKHCMGMYVGGNWYHLKAWEDVYAKKDVVGQLDVSILQEKVLSPVLGIRDPRTDERIRFVGGSHKLRELAEIADKTDGVAFAMYPTSMEDLMQIADEGKLMPPKSTWFEPKLRSGLFIHKLS